MIELYNLINKEYAEILISLINKKQSRKPKLYDINNIQLYILVLTDLQKWESLKLILKDKPKNHYKTIQDIHLKWSIENAYEEAYMILLKKYKLTNLKNSQNINLFIDTSLIYNKNGCENVSYGMNPKKKESKISVICDKNKTIYSITTQKTSMYDGHTINKSIESITKNKEIKYRTLNLIGDKGYALKKDDKEKLMIQHKINLVYPNRKNQKQKTSNKNKKLLKNRYVIENVFAKIKTFYRLVVRLDKLECTFRGFLFLASILKFTN